MKGETPSTERQISVRKTQYERLKRFFEANPHTIYGQETLAEAAGCAVSTVRSRISELNQDGFSLVWHQSGYMKHGESFIECKRWEHVPRPANALGPDASSPRERLLF